MQFLVRLSLPLIRAADPACSQDVGQTVDMRYRALDQGSAEQIALPVGLGPSVLTCDGADCPDKMAF